MQNMIISLSHILRRTQLLKLAKIAVITLYERKGFINLVKHESKNAT